MSFLWVSVWAHSELAVSSNSSLGTEWHNISRPKNCNFSLTVKFRKLANEKLFCWKKNPTTKERCLFALIFALRPRAKKKWVTLCDIGPKFQGCPLVLKWAQNDWKLSIDYNFFSFGKYMLCLSVENSLWIWVFVIILASISISLEINFI